MSAKRPTREAPPSIERATSAVAIAAADRGIQLTALDAMTLATAALASFDELVVVEDETSVGMWNVAETRDAVRRRLRDRAAVLALDEGLTITAHPHETITGLGPAGETLPLAEAAVAVVTHGYHARYLGTHSSNLRRLPESSATRDQPPPKDPTAEVRRPLRPV